MDHQTDEALVAAYLDDGDQRAFRLLVERHQERIYGYLLGMVRNRAVADDLFQETFTRVIDAMQRRRASYSKQGRWLAWVMRIARNAAIDHMRRRKKWSDVDGAREDGRSYWDDLPSEALPADEVLHRMRQYDWLAECIERLPPEQREVVLRDLEGREREPELGRRARLR